MAKLTDRLRAGAKHQVLLGVTGSGKMFTIANVITQLTRATLVLSHKETPAARRFAFASAALTPARFAATLWP